MEKEQFINWAEIEPLCLLRFLLMKLWLVVLAAAIGVMGISVYLQGDVSRSYSSNATFVVSSRSGAGFASNISAAVTSAESYAQLLESQQMKQVIWDAMGTQAPGNISVQQLGETHMIRVTVTADTPRAALETIQALIENYGVLADYIASDATLTVMSTPSVNVTQTRTIDPTTARQYAALICGGLMLALLAWMFVTGETIQNAEGAKNKLDMKVLASVPHNPKTSSWLHRKRTASRANITDPTVSFGFSESIHRISTHLESRKAEGKTVFLFTSVSESEGKSTVAANTALSLAMKNPKVLLIDLDLRRPVQAKILDMKVPEEEDMVTQLRSQRNAREILASAEAEKNTGLWTLLSRKNYAKAADLLTGNTLRELIALSRKYYDYVIVDLPPVGYFSDGEVLSDLCDASVLVVRQDLVSAGVINDAADSLRSGSAELLGCVLNDMSHLAPSSTGYGYGKYGYGKYGYGHYGYSHGRKDASSKAGREVRNG